MEREADQEQIDVGRYLRFVIVFLLLVFSALGAYQYYYGNQVKNYEKTQQSTESFATSTEESVL